MKFLFKRRKDQFKLTKELEAKYLDKWPWLVKWVKVERVQFYFGGILTIGGLLAYSAWLISTNLKGGDEVYFITHLPLLVAFSGCIYYFEACGLYRARKELIQKAEEGEL